MSLHHKRLTDDSACLHFKILKTLSIENAGIIDLGKLSFPKSSDKFASFIPSAGAASRYFASIKDLLVAIENKDLNSTKEELAKLDLEEIKSWAIPARTRELLVSGDEKLVLEYAATILKEIGFQKLFNRLYRGQAFRC